MSSHLEVSVSVAMCTYNGEEYLSEQLDSILNQTHKVNEIVVCDDNSTDSTWSILEKYQEKNPSLFRVYQNETLLGVIKNFEKTIDLSTSDIIILSDQDDIWKPNKVKSIVQEFSENPDALVLAHNIEILQDGHSNSKSFFELSEINSTWNTNELLFHVISVGKAFPGMSMAMRKEAKKYLPFKDAKGMLHDFQLVMDALKENRLVLVNQVLGSYRIHSNQLVGSNLNKNINQSPKSQIYKLLKRRKNIENLIQSYELNPDFMNLYHEKLNQLQSQYLNQYPKFARSIMKYKLHKDFPTLKNFQN